MKKIIAATLGLVFAGTAAFASPSIDYTPGAVTVELGSTLNSTFNGKGAIDDSVDGKSGFKYAVATGLGNNFALQYKGGHFVSEDFSAIGHTIHGISDLHEINLLYRISPEFSIVTGWVQNKVSYNNLISEAKVSGMHVGITGSKKLNDKSSLFAAYIAGSDTLFWEAGISNKIGQDTYLNVSYAVREFKDVDLFVPLLNQGSKEDYKLKGISCVVSTKL
ncbi:hypothetical protein [Sporomusa sp.]|uniref:hypothetical protein n=1 Tax=Sporomusa sp. TaxID=2078658 RepID=UPI002C6D1064|nr:hypothetical protein [Sporomusa sp.]HWR43990.1 hypothetical protein [Sporomusa sp.]